MSVALRMAAADVLKLRRRRGTLIWSLVLALGPQILYFVVRALQHSSDPLKYAPAGGIAGFPDALRLLTLFFGPLMAILIGVEAGTGDAAAGVFRDLVATGRARVALFASRVPAALALVWLITTAAYTLLLIGTFAFAAGSATPSLALLFEGFGFALLATGAICCVAVGLASLAASRSVALTVLIGWQMVASPLLAKISSLGSSRDAVLSQALVHFSPVEIGSDMHGQTVAMSGGLALAMVVLWLVVFLALGAWRTQTMDA